MSVHLASYTLFNAYFLSSEYALQLAINMLPTSALSFIKALPVVQFVKGEVQSADLLNHILVHEGVDTVMHFAAQART